MGMLLGAPRGVLVLEPQGNLFFLLILAGFGGLVTWVALAKQVALRVMAACLLFIPAMVFGIAAVNKYYDYYQTWGALFNDLAGQASSVPKLSAASLETGTAGSLKAVIAGSNAQLDSEYGLLFRTTITGRGSHISRQAYIYLPPQYFRKAYAGYRFPAIELLHGSPGQPAAWVNVMNVIPLFLNAIASRKAEPAVLVMPDTDGGQQYGLQCLNDPGGIQDMTYVGKEVPSWVAVSLRVQPPGPAWGVAGYSEGGFCATNIALQYAAGFGYAASLSGYFAPIESQVPVNGKPGGKPVDVNDFAHDKSLLLRNSPDKYITQVPTTVSVPQFFLAAGATDQGDVQAAEFFRQQLLLRVGSVPLMIAPGGGHQATVWRAALTPMFDWMTPQLAATARGADHAAAVRKAQRAAAVKRAAEQHRHATAARPSTA
jgi:hypothetical protein